MRSAPDIHETPPELEDATARIEQAKHNYVSLAEELNRFLYDYVKGMVKGFDRESGNFVLQLRHPRESNVKGRSRVLVSQIVENLRTALDYMIFQLSILNEPHLNERLPQFVIAETEPDFQRHAKTRLRYLNDEQKSFVEQIQPYRGNKMLTLLGKMTNAGKHRRLLSIRTGADRIRHLLCRNGETGRVQGLVCLSGGKGVCGVCQTEGTGDRAPDGQIRCDANVEGHDWTCRGHSPGVFLFLSGATAGVENRERLTVRSP